MEYAILQMRTFFRDFQLSPLEDETLRKKGQLLLAHKGVNTFIYELTLSEEGDKIGILEFLLKVFQLKTFLK